MSHYPATEPLLYPEVPSLPPLHRGKVRDSYDAGGDRLLLVASDRISAFDGILPTGVPNKGRVLTQLAAFWFRATAHLLPNHLISAEGREIARLTGLDPDLPALAGRAMLVRRARRIDVECVMRGYLAGSGWAEYQRHGTLAGLPLPPGLRESEALPAPAFTPAIKNDTGHDENISIDRLAGIAGRETAGSLEAASRTLYTFASRHALDRGMIVADTKFEFGLVDGSLMLIDEALTPDSSRFWDAAAYRPGAPQQSFDKQPVRDYLAALGWRGEAPAPTLPGETIAATSERYLTAFRRLTGQDLDG